MSSCERCWVDSHKDPYTDSAEKYQQLMKERVGDKACTPEQQAGPDAGVCSMCQRKTLHQHTQEPMCGCINRHHKWLIEQWRDEALRLRARVAELERTPQERGCEVRWGFDDMGTMQ